jgi:membrane protease YdiL (CAAX protease family)
LFFNPSEKRLHTGWRLLAHLVLLVGLYYAVAIFLAPLQAIFNLDESFTALFLFNTIIALIAITASVFLARRRFDKRTFTSLGLIWNHRAARDLLAGIGITGLIMSSIYAVEAVLGWLHFEAFAWQNEAPGAIAGSLLLYLAIYLAVGWQEELLCRGYWLQNMSEGLGTGWGVLLSSWVFALLHAFNPNSSPAAVFLLIASGLFLACGYLRTRQLWLPIGLHIGWNFFEGPVFGFAVSGTSPFTLINQTPTGPEFLTGGAFGPEAGLIVLPALLVGIVLIYWYTKERGSATSDRRSDLVS